ncbi:MAG: AAA family ATPase [Caldilineaceae bacterium]|nr:AAA family ATPase [Caldilineaceae bacterium]
MLHLQLLGDFRLVHNGIPITSISSQRQQSLLAYLALHSDTPQTRQHLAFLFWLDSNEAQARTNLRNLLHQLRRDLPQVERLLCISTKSVEWRSEAECSVDVAEFERALRQAEEAGADEQRIQAALEQAFACYTGDLLPALYDEWVLAERERLHTLFLQALDRLVVLLEGQRDYTRAIGYAVQLLHHDPLHEATYRRLMRLHALNHDRAAALRVYAACVEMLQRELGVAPGDETLALYQHLVSEDDLSRPSPESGSPIASTPLVGRQTAWRQVMDRWQRAAGGEPHLLLISGEAGIGKTRLAEELVQWTTRQGIAAAVARCYAVEESLSYGPVVSWLRSDPLQRVLPELDPVWQVELARLLPELHRPGLPQPEALTQGWQRQRLFEAVARAVMAVRPPLLLVLDDIQWCDAETLEWLHYLLRTCQQTRLLVAATLRIEEIDPGHLLVTWQQALQRQGMVCEVALGPLNQVQTEQLAALVAGQPLAAEVSDLLYRETEGHPLFIVEATRAGPDMARTLQPLSWSPELLAPLPTAMQLVIETRLNQLSLPSRQLINLAAVIGRQFTIDVLAAASGVDAQTLADGLDEALQRRIIREQGADGYDFSHDRIRETAYTTLSHIRRRLLHGQVAAALESVFDGRIEDVCGQLALHCERAGLTEQAVGYYRQAAETALRLYAHEDAIHLLSKSLQVLNALPQTPEREQRELDLQLMLGAGLTITRGYAAREVGEVYTRARMLAQRVEDKTLQFSALWGMRMFYANAGQSRVAVELGWQLLDLALAAGDEEMQLRARQSLGGALLHHGQFVLARDTLEQGVALYDPRRNRAQRFYYEIDPGVSCYALLILTLQMLGYPEQAQVRCHQTMSLIDELDHPASSVLALNYICSYHWMRGDAESNLACAERSLALCDKYGFTQLLGGALISRGNALADLGEIDEGITLLEQGVEMWEATGARNLVPFFLFMLANACTKAGQHERALSLLEDALAEMVERDERRAESELLRLKASLLHRRGAAPAQVEAIYQQALEIARVQQAKMLELRAAVDLSRFWQEQGRSAEARQLLADVYGWFTEGFDIPDLQEAGRLLNTLS